MPRRLRANRQTAWADPLGYTAAVIPLRDVIPSRTIPMVTVTLIGVHLVVFAGELLVPDRELQAVFRTWGVVPARMASFTLLTSLVLHGGWLHAIGNLLALWLFGENVEDRFGHLRFLLFYVACGLCAGLTYVWLAPLSRVPIVGAGGAVAGVIGAYVVLFPGSRILVAVPLAVRWNVIEVPATTFLGLWVVLQLAGAASALLAPSPGLLALSVPAAGFAAGAAAARLLERPERARPDWYDGR